MKTFPDIIQGSDEWYEIRLGKATASNFHKALAGGSGKTRKDYMKELAYERIHGIPFPKKFKGNASMATGNETEDEARDAFTRQTGFAVEQVGFIQHDDDIGYSPDGLISDDSLIEAKCPDTLTHMDYIDGKNLGIAYRYQMQGGMWITDRKQCWFISYDPRYPSNPLHYRLIKRDEKVIKEIRVGLVLFVQELKAMVERLTPKSMF